MIRAEQIDRQNVVWVDLGTIPDEVRGHEQANKRPCLILKTLDVSALAVVIPITTTDRTNLWSVVKIPKGIANLTEDSYALCYQIRSVSYERIIDFMGVLPDEHFNKVLEVLTDFLEL